MYFQFRQFFPDATESIWVRNALDMEYHVRNISESLETHEIVNNTLDAFRMLGTDEQRADMFRLLALWRYGGLYLAPGVTLTAPVSSFINTDTDSFILPMMKSNSSDHSRENRVGLMYSVPHHPFLERMIKKHVEYARSGTPSYDDAVLGRRADEVILFKQEYARSNFQNANKTCNT